MRSFPLYLLLFAGIFLSFNYIRSGSCPASSETAATAGNSIQFIEGDWTKALALAKTTHKPIFLDAYASWCGPCKQLKRKTFTDPAVAAYFNEHFVNVAVDMEKGQGPELSRQFAVRAYPTLLVLDENGTIRQRSVGFLSAGELLDFVQQSK